MKKLMPLLIKYKSFLKICNTKIHSNTQSYYIHLVIIIVVAAYLWINQYPNITNNSTWQSDVDLTGIFVGIAACMIAGVGFGLFWLEIMKRYASTIIKSMVCYTGYYYSNNINNI